MPRRSLSLRTRLTLIAGISIALLNGLVMFFSVFRLTTNVQEAALHEATASARIVAAEVGLRLERGMQMARDLAGQASDFANLPLTSRRSTLARVPRSLLAANPDYNAAWYIFEPQVLDGRDAQFRGQPGHTTQGRFAPFWRFEQQDLIYDYATEDAEGTVQEYYTTPMATRAPFMTEPYETTDMAGKPIRDISFTVPILVDGKAIGVAGIDKDLTDIKRLIDTFASDTGYAFLVAGDGSFVAHPRPEFVAKPLEAVLPATESKYGVLAAIKAGKELSFSEESPVNGEQVLTVFEPLVLTGQKPWSVGLSTPWRSVMAPVVSTSVVLGLAGATTLLIILLVIYWIVRSSLRPLIRLELALSDVASGDGDLTRRLGVERSDEIGRMATAFNSFAQQIGALVRDVQGGATQLAQDGSRLRIDMKTSAEAVAKISEAVVRVESLVEQQHAGVNSSMAAVREIAAGTNRLASSIEVQAAGVTEGTASVHEMVANIASVGHSIDLIAAELASLVEAAQRGRLRIAEAAQASQAIARQSDSLQEVNAAITGIAARTNLLAMNAAIEAAHAGSSGAGFAVVAREIRTLAEEAGSHAKRSTKELHQVRGSIEHVVKASAETGATFGEVDALIGKVNDLTLSVKNALAEQNEGSKQLIVALGEINEATQVVRDSSAEMGLSSLAVLDGMGKLEELSQGIRSLMARVSTESRSIGEVTTASLVTSEQAAAGIEDLVVKTGRFKV